MSAETAAFYQAGIRCDHAGCEVSIWRVAPSREIAATNVQRDAKAAGWQVAADRLYEHLPVMYSLAKAVLGRDLCPDHVGRLVQPVHGATP